MRPQSTEYFSCGFSSLPLFIVKTLACIKHFKYKQWRRLQLQNLKLYLPGSYSLWQTWGYEMNVEVSEKGALKV